MALPTSERERAKAAAELRTRYTTLRKAACEMRVKQRRWQAAITVIEVEGDPDLTQERVHAEWRVDLLLSEEWRPQ